MGINPLGGISIAMELDKYIAQKEDSAWAVQRRNAIEATVNSAWTQYIEYWSRGNPGDYKLCVSRLIVLLYYGYGNLVRALERYYPLRPFNSVNWG